MTASDIRALPTSLRSNPRLGDWLRILPAGVVEVRSGKVELGQGVLTALAQVVAEELDIEVARVRMIGAQTGRSPDEGYTAASMSIQQSGAALRMVAAETRARYIAVAADRWGIAEEAVDIAGGAIVAADGRSTSYWELADDTLLDRKVTGTCEPKEPSSYTLVGTSVPRIDLPALGVGTPRFVHDLSFDGMLYGRVVRPPSRGAVLAGVDTTAVTGTGGIVAVIRDGDFLGIVAEREELAVHAAEVLRTHATWDEHPTLPDEDQLATFLTTAPADTTVLAEEGNIAPGTTAAASHEAVFHRPYLAHAAMGPSCAVAHFTAGDHPTLQVWTHSQGVYVLRRELARALDMDEARITVHHVKGPGCYGHNGADDAAMDAVMMAQAVPERHVQVVWSRADELTWAPFGPAAVVRVAADVDTRGDVLSWRHEIWGSSHNTRPGFVPGIGLLAASHRQGGQEIVAGPEAPLEHGGTAGRNSVPGYAFPAYRVVNHQISTMPLRTSAMRALGAFVNVFAIESVMDDLAAAAGRDPVEYRLSQLRDSRARAVIEAAAQAFGWDTWSPTDSVGRGIGYARYKNSSAYCAVLAEVEAIAEVRVRRLVIAVDAGLVINPDGAINQIEGGAIQATSWALKERVRFDRASVTSDTWESYPILRFSEVPRVAVELMPGAGHPSLGVGETSQGPTAAAIANALYDALGVRVRTLPLTEEHIVAAMPD
ncbi:xanthine dehydrogenase family protein molybdopterin-binding subunit [Mycolicibacterium canariasense]|uniref:xanthine dehydrogenase family protein molybdopterin-binding subunit n=1 Tax=Mycolicibacterium canariasense TaxID=228230 RepID=UPI000AC3C352|nr:molybdopterin cofactor-binding domain-containing protein [Mycolicibacterium canariasense]